jgi:hypothetical protein
MGFAYRHVPAMREMLEAAMSFGLSEAEVRRAVDDCLFRSEQDAAMVDYADEVAGALARAILSKQRRLADEQLS